MPSGEESYRFVRRSWVFSIFFFLFIFKVLAGRNARKSRSEVEWRFYLFPIACCDSNTSSLLNFSIMFQNCRAIFFLCIPLFWECAGSLGFFPSLFALTVHACVRACTVNTVPNSHRVDLMGVATFPRLRAGPETMTLRVAVLALCNPPGVFWNLHFFFIKPAFRESELIARRPV